MGYAFYLFLTKLIRRSFLPVNFTAKVIP